MSESKTDFEWMIDNFLSMMGKAPGLLITDQDINMEEIIKTKLGPLGTTHSLCIWHLGQNMIKHLKGQKEFKKLQALFWNAASTPYVDQFDRDMDVMENLVRGEASQAEPEMNVATLLEHFERIKKDYELEKR